MGLMASAILVVHLGRLHMREFQLWVASCGLDPVRHGTRRVLVTPGCARALRHWRIPSFLTHGVPMDSVLSRKVVTTDASLTSWDGIYEGRSVRGPPAVTHKFSGTLNGFSLPETFHSVSHGSSCPGEDGQYDDGGVHQPSGGLTLPSVAHAGTQTDPVELRSSSLPESDARPGSPEHGRRPIVQGCPDHWYHHGIWLWFWRGFFFSLWVGGRWISLSGNTGATISYSETSSEIL